MFNNTNQVPANTYAAEIGPTYYRERGTANMSAPFVFSNLSNSVLPNSADVSNLWKNVVDENKGFFFPPASQNVAVAPAEAEKQFSMQVFTGSNAERANGQDREDLSKANFARSINQLADRGSPYDDERKQLGNDLSLPLFTSKGNLASQTGVPEQFRREVMTYIGTSNSIIQNQQHMMDIKHFNGATSERHPSQNMMHAAPAFADQSQQQRKKLTRDDFVADMGAINKLFPL